MFSFQGASQSYVHAPLDFVSSVARSASFSTFSFFFKKLNETSKFLSLFQSISWIWWRVPGSNRWPPACKAGALPAELTPHRVFNSVVGQNGLEPSTSRLSVVCSSQLSYWPVFDFPLFSTVPSKLNNVKTLTLCTDLRTLRMRNLSHSKSP